MRIADTLNPCECGGTPELARRVHPLFGTMGDLVTCPQCKRRTDAFKTAEQAASAWNYGEKRLYQ